ncbi:flagellar biosynthesis anti-sigma factor FlgM [Tenuibacillus multivorans]|uniref:Negative regulator of flagellin synthesis n=1 Tax=Tenuibacillus multivorans TaxID=237069 RepID=A0A1H0G7G1_9BACI|nr:flagellar biosynthesis anti-sigma factor FlgM [Tenuibacillus multivorans]GEL78713.1 negative regulator of flagellin synthesis [Tenuibacillus multivorans]SDO02812.1 negative regulator of flagellin synthesis FlgM [Tenuibacillus multivorans]
MKINPLNNTNLNPYLKQMQKQDNVKNTQQPQDKLEISNQAKKLQDGNEIVEARQEKVKELKQQVENGDYQIDPKKTAEKMIEFWNNRRV